MKFDTAPPRGMKDLLPPEVELRDRASAIILATYKRYGFRRVETPALENLRLLLGSGGGENEKLIYKVLKRGAKLDAATTQREDDLADLGLRFDLTVPLARYYAHNRATLPDPFKAIQIGPVWRAERPQKGRFRQFTQCDIDILGVQSEIAEIELILATADALSAIGLEGLTVRINDRRLLTSLVRHCGFEEGRFDSVFIALDKLDKIEAAGVVKELVEEGHAGPAISALMALLETSTAATPTPERLAQRLGDSLDPAASRALTRIIDTVSGAAAGRLRVVFDPSLVRGMSYYTGPIFEIRHRNEASSIAGGGRYDRMIGKLLGHDVPATGFSIGFERVINILTERGSAGVDRRAKTAIVFDQDTAHLAAVLAMAHDLWDDGRVVMLELNAKRLGKQLQDLESRGFGRVVVFDADGRARDADLTPRPERERPA